MTVYNGVLNPGIFVDTQKMCSANIYNADQGAPTLYSPVNGPSPIDESEHTFIGAPMRQDGFDGTKVESMLDDYYYRIHASPMTLALGAILSPINEEFIVWNAWFQSKTFSSITKTNPTEFTLIGQTAPYTMKALEYLTYEVDVPEEGQTDFAATITFEFTTESVVISLSGTRIIAFVWEPQFPMKETLEWLTQIIKGKSGKEQRISLRRTARQRFGMSIFFHNEQEQAEFEAQLFTWQKQTWGVPVWAEKVAHSGTINVGDTSISVDTRYADFRDDSLAMVFQNRDNYEVVKVETKTNSVLNLEVEMQNSFSGDKFIMPVRVAQIPKRVNSKFDADGNAYASIEFLVNLNALLSGYSAVETYLGLTVLTDPSYAEESLTYESDGDIVISDGGTGPFDIFSDSEFNEMSQGHAFKNWDKMECWTFRLFLHHLYGRQVSFWRPTFKNDLQLTQNIGAADLTFRCSNLNYTDNMGVNDLRKHIAFMLPDGTNYYREITGIVESGSEEIVSISSSLGVLIQPGDCEICFLDKVRLASDEVEINWVEPYRNICDTKFVRVEE